MHRRSRLALIALLALVSILGRTPTAATKGNGGRAPEPHIREFLDRNKERIKELLGRGRAEEELKRALERELSQSNKELSQETIEEAFKAIARSQPALVRNDFLEHLTTLQSAPKDFQVSPSNSTTPPQLGNVCVICASRPRQSNLSGALQEREKARFQNDRLASIRAQAELSCELNLVRELATKEQSPAERFAAEQILKNHFLVLPKEKRAESVDRLEQRVNALERSAVQDPRQRLELGRARAELALAQAAKDQPQIELKLSVRKSPKEREHELRDETILQLEKELIRSGNHPDLRKELEQLRKREPRRVSKSPPDPARLSELAHTRLSDLHIGHLYSLVQKALRPSEPGVEGRRVEANIRLVHAVVLDYAPKKAPVDVETFEWMFVGQTELKDQRDALEQARTAWQRYKRDPRANSRAVDANIERLDRHIKQADIRSRSGATDAGWALLAEAIKAMPEQERLRLTRILEGLPEDVIASPEGQGSYYHVLLREERTGQLSPAETEALRRLAVSGLTSQADKVILSMRTFDAHATARSIPRTEPQFAATRSALESCLLSLRASLAAHADREPERVGSVLKRLDAVIPLKRGPPPDRAEPYDDVQILNAQRAVRHYVGRTQAENPRPASPPP